MSSVTRQRSRPGALTARLDAEARRVCDRIARRYSPDKIILFGSVATGRAGEDSDIDLLVIKRTKKPYFDRVLEVRRAAATRRPLDVFVLTPPEFQQAIAERRYLLVKEILPKGRTIYERPRTRSRRSRVA